MATSDGDWALPAASKPGAARAGVTRSDARPQIRIFIEGMVLHHLEESDRYRPRLERRHATSIAATRSLKWGRFRPSARGSTCRP